MPRTIRNAILQDPETGVRSVVLADTDVDDATAALLDPAAFGSPAAAPAVQVEHRVVDETPLLDAVRSYATFRGLDVEGLSGIEILEGLAGFDADLSARLQAAEVDDDARTGQVDPRVAEILEGSLDEVNAHLDEHPEDVETVLAAEAAGKARKGITHGPHGTKQE